MSAKLAEPGHQSRSRSWTGRGAASELELPGDGGVGRVMSDIAGPRGTPKSACSLFTRVLRRIAEWGRTGEPRRAPVASGALMGCFLTVTQASSLLKQLFVSPPQNHLQRSGDDLILTNSNFIDGGATINAVSPEFCHLAGLNGKISSHNTVIPTLANDQQMTVPNRTVKLHWFVDSCSFAYGSLSGTSGWIYNSECRC